jgi:hypothetical protein
LLQRADVLCLRISSYDVANFGLYSRLCPICYRFPSFYSAFLRKLHFSREESESMINRVRVSSSLLAAAAVVALVAISPTLCATAEAQSVNWKRLSPPKSPSARAGVAMAYDPVSKKIVVFGGLTASRYLNETWTFDGTTWARQKTTVAPLARVEASMALDRVTRKLVLFGGYDGTHFLGDTWLWDGATARWTQAHPKSSPTAVSGPMLFTDPKNGHADEFGGYDGNFYQLTTWRWTGKNWTQLQPTNVPGARAFAVAALDSARKNVVLFAGLGDVRTDNTWTWDGTNWTQQSPTVQPNTRYDAGSAFDPKLQMVTIFGGGVGGTDLNETWAWTGTDWTQLNPPKSPAAREAVRMAYDAASGQLLVFGGLAGQTFFGDTWKLIGH